MKRRTLLGTASSVGIIALTGCLGGGEGDGTPTDTETATETDTDTPSPTLTDSGFTVVNNENGVQTDNARVSVDGSKVVVEGTIWGRDGCRTATLGSTNYNTESDELTVDVATTRTEDAGDMCTQAIVEITYRATISFENGLPGSVVVTHSRGDTSEEVTTTSL
ncbi:hypothetical protein NDI56_19030 [Haloarcula sp. S1CR25-12]|uniref:Uncharacterized protein n=1 Tax=Haloarcula saliterrae TaxID=2950534 RepID=A0ABU2FGW9_9EURY|nr:hypothetical protein [Haloarcula sp. S1CR25-12]MDS0261499.1 hypothetical protein [Haloarcula sp. S1CR25-12]